MRRGETRGPRGPRRADWSLRLRCAHASYATERRGVHSNCLGAPTLEFWSLLELLAGEVDKEVAISSPAPVLNGSSPGRSAAAR